MSVLGLWTLASALGCCIGFTIIQRPAEYYDYRRNPQDYQWQPSDHQWEPLEYQWQPSDYQGQPYDYQPYDYQPYDYQPYDYQPYDYQPYEYQPNYSSYYYYYPLYDLSVPFGYDTNPKIPYAEAQQLLQVYRVIRVIVVFRIPVHKPLTSLDWLVHELTDETLQEKLVKLLRNVHGYEEVAELINDPSVKLKHSFVNDYRRLLWAIQRALNALHLTTELDDDLYGKLRKLRDQANALTVEQIEAELERGLKGHAKEALVSDVLETKDLEESHEKYDIVVEEEDDDVPLDLDNEEMFQVVIDEPEENLPQETKDRHEIKEEDLDELAAALELYLEEQKIAEAKLVKEKSSTGQEQVVEPDTTAASTTTMVYTTTHTPLIPTPAEATKDTWLGSLFGKGNLLAGHYGSPNEVPESQKLPHPIDVSQPAVLIEQEVLETNELDNQNVWIHEENLNKDPLDFDIDQRFQSLTPTIASAEKPNAVTHSVPLWLIDNSKNQMVEKKQTELEDIIEDENEVDDELERQLPDDEDEQEVDTIKLEDKIEGRTDEDYGLLQEVPKKTNTEIEEVTEQAAKGEDREISVDEEKLQTVEEEGPARFDLPVDLIDHHQLNSTPEPVPIDEQQELQRLDVTTEASATSTAPVDQLTTLNVNEVHTENTPVESREEPTSVAQTEPVTIDEQQERQRLDATTDASPSSVPAVGQLTTLNIYEVHTESSPVESREEPTSFTQTATSEPDARRFVREEVLKVLNLLEESNGFTELKEHITEQDLNELVEELSRVQVGIRWTEMISALQKLIANKKLVNGARIVEILEHWKDGEEGHLDDGYFDRTYGKSELAENRQIEEKIDEVDMEQIQLAQLQAAIMQSRDLEEDDHAEAVTKRVLFVDDKDNYFNGAYNLTNNTANESLRLNGSESHNSTHAQLQNGTESTGDESSTELPIENRNPRIINVDDNQNEFDSSTQGPLVIEESAIPHSLQEEEEEVTDKLEVTTPQPFPANET